MKQEIRISKKSPQKGEDGHKVVSVRMKDETLTRLDEMSIATNRSRNEIINILLESAIKIVTITSEDE